MKNNWIWILLGGVGVYAAYEWLSGQCATAGSSMYGGSLCNSLFPVPATGAPVLAANTSTPAPTTQTATPTATPTQSSVTEAQQAQPIIATPPPVVPQGQPIVPGQGQPFQCPRNALCMRPQLPFAPMAGTSGLAANRIPMHVFAQKPRWM